MDWETLRSDARQALRHWTAVEPLSVEPVHSGTLNWNFRVILPSGEFLLRCHRDDLASERIAGEHALLEWVVDHGIPAPAAIPADSGVTLVPFSTHRWSLAKWLPGDQPDRGTLSAGQIRSLGHMHGRVQSTLAQHPDSSAASMSMRWDKGESLAALPGLIEVASQRGEEGWIVEALKRQLTLLEGMDVLAPNDVQSLPVQLLHGDFHDQQVLFVGDEVSAVVDWENWHTDPRAWELIRSLAFSMLLDPPHFEAYLSGYREHILLDEDEIVLTLRLWFQSRVVGLWAWQAYLLEGNDRVRQFFPEMTRQLDLLADPQWRDAITHAIIQAARG